MDIAQPTAVVLEGGGAKGAYTAAVLKVLTERSANIVAVAGASAGALNAVALGVGRIEEARQAWEELTIWHLLSPHGTSRLSKVLKMTHAAWALTLLLVNVGSASFSNRHDYFRRQGYDTKLPTLCFVAAIFLAAVSATSLLFDFRAHRAEIIVGPLFGLIALSMLYGAPRQHRSIVLAAMTFYPIFLFGFSLINPLFPEQRISYAFANTGSFAFATAVAIAIGYAAATYPARHFALIATPHLQVTLRRFLQYPWIMDCYAVISCRARTIDEDVPFVRDSHAPLTIDVNYGLNLSPYYEYVPLYRNLKALSTATSVRVLTASAALPLGIIKPEVIHGMAFEDGGLSDNRPIIPLLARSPLEQLLVVLLSPVLEDGQVVDLATRKGQASARRQIVGEVTKTGRSRQRRYVYRAFARQFNLPGTSDMIPLSAAAGDVGRATVSSAVRQLLGDRPDSAWQEMVANRNIMVIAPSRNLGGLIRGTLAFFPSTIQRLSAEGEADACRILAGLACHANANEP